MWWAAQLSGRSPAQKPEIFGSAPDVLKSRANPRNLLIELCQRLRPACWNSRLKTGLALPHSLQSAVQIVSGAPTAKRLRMLRITVVESSGEAARLRVEGRMTDGWVEELRKTCDLQGLGDGVRLTLDLADVAFVDAAGIELLKELKRRRVTLLNPTSFVAQQLQDAARSDGPCKDCPSSGNR
jgi:hypothetical protein